MKFVFNMNCDEFSCAYRGYSLNELGDFNQDSVLDVLDVLGIINYIIENEYHNYYAWASDINEDNNVDIL